jgi:methyl-accepting chemotaxis protein
MRVRVLKELLLFLLFITVVYSYLFKVKNKEEQPMNSIRYKLLGSYVFINLFVILVTVVSFNGFSQIAMSTDTRQMSQNERIVFTQMSQLIEVMRNSQQALLNQNDATAIDKFNDAMSQIDTMIGTISKNGKTPLAQTLLYVLSQSIHNYARFFNEDTVVQWEGYQNEKAALTTKILQDASVSETSQASLDYLYKAKIKQIQSQMDKEQIKIFKATNHLLDLVKAEEAVNETQMMNIQQLVKRIVLAVAIISLLASVVVSFMMARSIIKPILMLKKQTQAFADGHLTAEITMKRQDEFGELTKHFNDMIQRIKLLVIRVQESIATGHTSMLDLEESAQKVLNTSSDVNDTLEVVIHNNEKNAKELLTISQKFDQVSHNIDDANQAISIIVDLTHHGTQLAHQGLSNMDQTIEQMQTMTQQFDEMMERVVVLEEKSDGINNVIELIQAIGHQTNLLALNASIEAARAGAAGKGFGVVADEIRKLAQETATATQDIRDMLQAIISESYGIGGIVQNTKVEVDKSKMSVENSKTQFINIVGALNDLEDRIDIAAVGIEGIQKTSAQVLEGTHTILESSQSNLSHNRHIGDNMVDQIQLSKETVQICEEVDKQFSHLKDLISYFKS